MTGNFIDNHECDITKDDLYIAGYKCGGVCGMNQNVKIELNCDFYQQVGPISFIKQCEWKYKDNKKCKNVPESDLKNKSGYCSI
jgi:hypothetical protein